MAQYRAFFSYARADDKLANWLHRQLDGYRTPKALIGQDGAMGPVPAKLHPIFRDRTDLDARGHIDQRLQEALEDSECLVVLCTPTSAKSHWVNHECETFLKLGREDRIFPVIGAGEPNSGDPKTECFPPALRGKGLLAADLREIKKPSGQLIGDGRDDGRLKLIAGLLGVPLDQLVQRERRRQRLLVGALGAAALVFAGVAATAVVQTIMANRNAEIAAINEGRAATGEAEAKRQQAVAETNAAAERKARADERAQRQRADEETLKALANAREAERQKGEASESARQARANLHQFFAVEGRNALERDNSPAAARYALAGAAVSPDLEPLFRDVLAASLSKASLPIVIATDQKSFSSIHLGPDSMSLVGVGSEQIQLIDLPSRKVIRTISPNIGNLHRRSQISPDGQYLAITSDRGGRVLNTSTGETVLRFRRGFGVFAFGFSRDSSLLAVRGSENTVHVHDLKTPGQHQELRFNGRYPNAASFNAQRNLVSVTSVGDGVEVFSLANGSTVFRHEDSRNLNAHALFSHDGEQLIIAYGKYLESWSARTWTRRFRSELPSGGNEFMVISPDESRVAIVTSRGRVLMYDANGVPITSFETSDGIIEDVSFSSDSQYILTAGSDQSARMWRANDGGRSGHFAGHRGWINGALFLPDDKAVVTASSDGTIRLWPLEPKVSVQPIQGPMGLEFELGWTGNDDGLFVSTFTGTYLLSPLERLTANIKHFPGSYGRISLNGSRILSWHPENQVAVRDVMTGAILRRLRVGDARTVDYQISPDGESMVVVTASALFIGKVDAGDLQEVPLDDCNHHKIAVDWPRLVLAVIGCEKITLWDMPQKKRILERGFLTTRYAREIEFSPDGKYLLVSSTSPLSHAALVESATGAVVRMVTVSRGQTSRSARFSPNGRVVVITSTAGPTSILSARDFVELARLPEYSYAVFSRSGGRLAAVSFAYGSGDAKLALWDMPVWDAEFEELKRLACGSILATDRDQKFEASEINNSPLLMAEWPDASRKVC